MSLTDRAILRSCGIAVALGAAFAVSPAAHADHIALRGGGSITGAILPADAQRPEILRVQTRTSAQPLEVRKAQVLRVDSVDDDLREYLVKLAAVQATAESEFELAEWCESSSLSGPARRHLQRAIELNSEFAPAHAKLGNVYHDGRWMTLDERRKAQGLVFYKGRWVLPDDKRQLEAKTALVAEQESWLRQLKLLRKKLLSNDRAQAQQADQQLSAIRDGLAVVPLVKVFGEDPEPIRIRLAQTIAAIPGDDSLEALIRLLLTEPVQEVREETLRELELRKDSKTIPRLVKALEMKDPVAVGRAAWALATLDAVSAVPNLIPVLVKTEKKWVVDPTVGDDSGGINATFVSPNGMRAIPANAGGVAAGGATGVVGPGYATGGSLPVLTGPVVGNGVAAYGATSIPFGSFTGLSNGVNANKPNAQLITQVYQNEGVLQALRDLTGMDFGYDIKAWKQWLGSGFRPNTTPERRVPQP
jgi:hypothetical protein